MKFHLTQSTGNAQISCCGGTAACCAIQPHLHEVTFVADWLRTAAAAKLARMCTCFLLRALSYAFLLTFYWSNRNVSLACVSRLTSMCECCRYYVEVAPCDVQAVLENHTHLEDIDIMRLPLLASSQDQDSLELPSTPQKADRGSVLPQPCALIPALSELGYEFVTCSATLVSSSTHMPRLSQSLCLTSVPPWTVWHVGVHKASG